MKLAFLLAAAGLGLASLAPAEAAEHAVRIENMRFVPATLQVLSSAAAR